MIQHQEQGEAWTMILGDCVQAIADIPDQSVHFTIFSPPFSSLYIYSDNEADMGNCEDDEEFFEHFRYLIPELLRVTVPGRLCAVHATELATFKWRDDVIGRRDFPGRIISEFCDAGWLYHSRVTIWKDPVVEMQRTKSLGLLYKQLQKNSAYSRQGFADYVLVFKRWADGGDEPDPVKQSRDEFPLEQWQRWASPVWMDIDQTEVLNYRIAREDKDEKHICPLQLGVAERCVRLWSNPGDVVFSPFAGIGSEGYEALRAGRKFVGIELKRSYFDWACRNLRSVEEFQQQDLFHSARD